MTNHAAEIGHEEIAKAINVARIQRRWSPVAIAAGGECAQIAREIGERK